MIDLKNLTIKQAHDDMKAGKYTAVSLTQACLDVVSNKNRSINAYLGMYDSALKQAKDADEKFKKGEATLMTGIPIAVKDNILIKGETASSASKILENYEAVYDATVINKLKDAGAVFLGRTNMDEFAMGGSTENSAYGVTKNPHDISRVSGGSSGGSAAALSMGGALAALGSDTGGSVRQPASFCGVVGLKPTYGAVSRFGLMAMGSSLDQIGTFGKTTEDAEIIFNAIKGYDKNDSTSAPENFYEKENLSRKMTIGVPENFIEKDGIDEDVLSNFRQTIDKLKNKGYEVKNVSLPNIKYSLAAYYIVMPAEASTNLARFDGVRYGLLKEGGTGIDDYMKTRGAGFGKEVRRRIMLGTYVLSAGYYDAYYGKATMARGMIKKDFEEAFREVDAIITPTSPTPAFKIGEKAKEPLQMYLADIFTVPVNLAGVPAISVPSGFAERDGVKLPLGCQVIAPHFKEERLFKIGKDIES